MDKKQSRFNLKFGQGTNLIIALLGIITILVGILWKSHPVRQTILLSIGTSMIASAIVAFLNAYYMLESNKVKQLIKTWHLQQLYKTRAEMNGCESNTALRNCSKNIDIIAEGMHNFLSVQGSVLSEKLNNGVKIRIISCDSETMLAQRYRDESRSGKCEGNATADQVYELFCWVKEQSKNGNLEIRFHNSYPAFSYLRIDSHVFIGPNLWHRPSQQSFAMSFDGGEGAEYFQNYFDELWNSEFVHPELHLNIKQMEGD